MTRFSSQKISEESSQQASMASTRKPRTKAKRGEGIDTTQNQINTANQQPSTGNTVSKKRKIATPQFSRATNAYTSGSGDVPKTNATMPTTDEDVTNNVGFAREMAVARAGTQFAGSGKPGTSKKEQRAQKQEGLRPGNGTDSPPLSTGASSTTGADADDDLSPVASPPLAATSTVATSKSGDISDMLEMPTAGPSILRLTEPANPASQARAKQIKKAFEPAETKKQRQQRIKREANRAQVEEAERERRRLLEKQIRGARMADGTSAQTRSSAFKPPAQNAWFSGPNPPSIETVDAPVDGSPSLLDTFEPQLELATSLKDDNHAAPLPTVTCQNVSTDENRTSIRAEQEAVGEGKAQKNDKDWERDLPVEEEQLRLIQNSEDSWTTVSKRDKKKALKLHASRETDTSEASGVENRHVNGIAPRPAFSSSSNSYYKLGDSGFQDSDWAA